MRVPCMFRGCGDHVVRIHELFASGCNNGKVWYHISMGENLQLQHPLEKRVDSFVKAKHITLVAVTCTCAILGS